MIHVQVDGTFDICQDTVLLVRYGRFRQSKLEPNHGNRQSPAKNGSRMIHWVPEVLGLTGKIQEEPSTGIGSISMSDT